MTSKKAFLESLQSAEVTVEEDMCPRLIEWTPKLSAEAEEKMSFDQRKLSKKKRDLYVRVMEEGGWGYTDSMVVYDPQIRFINGRTRLAAIVKSGIAQKIWTVMLPHEAILNFDDGLRRRTEHFMTEPYRFVLAAAANFFYSYKKDRSFPPSLANTPTNKMKVRLIKNNPRLEKSAEFIFSLKGRPVVDLGAQSFLHFFFHGKPELEEEMERLDRFFERLRSGDGLVKGDPERTLRDTILHARKKPTAREKRAFLVMAVKACLKGTKLCSLKYDDDKDKFPSIWPIRNSPKPKLFRHTLAMTTSNRRLSGDQRTRLAAAAKVKRY